MFINYAYHQKIESSELVCESLQEHARQYFSDLYVMYDKPQEIMKTNLFHTYIDAAAYLFDDVCRQKIANEADYLFFPSWGWVFDVHCIAPELYLKNKFKWRGSILDIRDCGSLCVYYALFLSLNFCKNTDISDNTICSIENAFESENKNREAVFPEINYVALLSLSSEKKSTFNIEIIHCDIFNYQIIENNKNQIDRIISRIAYRHSLSENQYHVVIRKIDESIDVFKDANLIIYPASSGFLYDVVSKIFQKDLNINFEYVFIIDFDLVTKRCGVLLSRMWR